MTREIIEDYRKIILPFMKKRLLEINYENQGKSDADEFEKDFNEILNLAAKALEQEPCEDTISRQAVLEQTYNWSKDEFLRATNPFDYLRKRINSLPSVTPQKMGKWEIVTCDLYMCSKCYGKYTYKSNFCPNCGAKMEVEE